MTISTRKKNTPAASSATTEVPAAVAPAVAPVVEKPPAAPAEASTPKVAPATKFAKAVTKAAAAAAAAPAPSLFVLPETREKSLLEIVEMEDDLLASIRQDIANAPPKPITPKSPAPTEGKKGKKSSIPPNPLHHLYIDDSLLDSVRIECGSSVTTDSSAPLMTNPVAAVPVTKKAKKPAKAVEPVIAVLSEETPSKAVKVNNGERKFAEIQPQLQLIVATLKSKNESKKSMRKMKERISDYLEKALGLDETAGDDEEREEGDEHPADPVMDKAIVDNLRDFIAILPTNAEQTSSSSKKGGEEYPLGDPRKNSFSGPEGNFFLNAICKGAFFHLSKRNLEIKGKGKNKNPEVPDPDGSRKSLTFQGVGRRLGINRGRIAKNMLSENSAANDEEKSKKRKRVEGEN